MKPAKTLATSVFVSALLGLPGFARAADMQMTAASRQQLIDSVITAVNTSYVFPDLAKQAEAALRAQHRRGAYDALTSARQLSEALTRELQATTRDRHLRVTYSEDAIPETRPQSSPSTDERAGRLAMLRAQNFGVEKIERLPFNIGYLDLAAFMSARDSAETLGAAMTVLAHTDALIIDLRNNWGGDSGTVTLLASYLFDQRTRLNDFYYREGDRLEQRWTADAVPGLRYGQKKDVYILTSRETFSAAEDFTYALKNLKRATVVGETTGGGANPGVDRRLLPHFSMFMPLGRAVSPVTQANWEGVGVAPDVGVCAADALATAQVAILKKMTQSEKDSGQLAALAQRIAQISATATCR